MNHCKIDPLVAGRPRRGRSDRRAARTADEARGRLHSAHGAPTWRPSGWRRIQQGRPRQDRVRLGGSRPSAGKKHYYRVQGPTFLIEYDNTQNDGNHIHSVWRDFNGDFGRDLLREHVHAYVH